MAEFESNKKAKVYLDGSESVLAVAQIQVKGIDGAVVDERELPLSTTAAEMKTLVSETTGRPTSISRWEGTSLSWTALAHWPSTAARRRRRR